jgi:dipeptidyl aminopeptidase/acylaminoacyl peptidase
MSFIGTTDIPTAFSRELWGGYWFRRDEAQLYWQRSPLRYVEASRTPLLMLHGEADTRVPPTQSIELFTSLRAAGRARGALELVLYPGEPHHISTRAHELDVIRRVLAWFARHLPPGVAAGDSAGPHG